MSMKIESFTGWAVAVKWEPGPTRVGDTHGLLDDTLRGHRYDAITAFLRRYRWAYQVYRQTREEAWREARREGYRCVRVRLSATETKR